MKRIERTNRLRVVVCSLVHHAGGSNSYQLIYIMDYEFDDAISDDGDEKEEGEETGANPLDDDEDGENEPKDE